MLARRRQSRATTVSADDTESARDAPTPTGKDRRSPPASTRSRTSHLSAVASSGVAAAASRRRAGQHHRPRTPTSSPEPDAPSQPAAAAGGRSGAEPAAAGHGKTPFKYKRVKDSVRLPQKHGHVPLSSRKSDAYQEGIFD